MLILCRIAVAEAGKTYWKNTLQIPHFLTNMTAGIDRRVNATSRKRVEIQDYHKRKQENIST